MEYPTFITAGTCRLLNRWPLDRVLPARGGGRPRVRPPVLAGHGRPRTSSRSRGSTRASTEYSTGKVVDELSAPMLDAGGARAARRRARAVAPRRTRSSAWNASGSPPGAVRHRLRLQLLRTHRADAAHARRALGAETLARAMRTYHERLRFRHPTSDDFYGVVSEVAGRDLSVLPPDDRIVGSGRLLRRRDHAGRRLHRRHGAARGRPADAGRRGVQVRRASRRAPQLGRRRAMDALHVRLRRAARVGRRGSRSQDRPRRVVAEQRARGGRRSTRARRR